MSPVPLVLRSLVWLLQKTGAHMERGGTGAEGLWVPGPRGEDGRHGVLWWDSAFNVHTGIVPPR